MAPAGRQVFHNLGDAGRPSVDLDRFNIRRCHLCIAQPCSKILQHLVCLQTFKRFSASCSGSLLIDPFMGIRASSNFCLFTPGRQVLTAIHSGDHCELHSRSSPIWGGSMRVLMEEWHTSLVSISPSSACLCQVGRCSQRSISGDHCELHLHISPIWGGSMRVLMEEWYTSMVPISPSWLVLSLPDWLV